MQTELRDTARQWSRGPPPAEEKQTTNRKPRRISARRLSGTGCFDVLRQRISRLSGDRPPQRQPKQRGWKEAGKNVSKLTYFGSRWTLNLNPCRHNQAATKPGSLVLISCIVRRYRFRRMVASVYSLCSLYFLRLFLPFSVFFFFPVLAKRTWLGGTSQN